MAQTKRKRRTKHRGNAAGAVESRGRTGRKPLPAETTKSSSSPAALSREERMLKEPTLMGSVQRSIVAAAVLAVLFIVGIGGKQEWYISALLVVGAFVIYIPIGHATDKAMWKRRMRKAGRPLPESASRGRR